LVVFDNSAKPSELRFTVADTPAKNVVKVSRLFGEASAELNGKEVHIRAPGESLSIFSLD